MYFGHAGLSTSDILVGDSFLSWLFIFVFWKAILVHSRSISTTLSSNSKSQRVYKSMARRNLTWSLVCIVSTFFNMLLTSMISLGWFRVDPGPQWPNMLSTGSALFDILINMCCMLMISHSWIPKSFSFLRALHPSSQKQNISSQPSRWDRWAPCALFRRIWGSQSSAVHPIQILEFRSQNDNELKERRDGEDS